MWHIQDQGNYQHFIDEEMGLERFNKCPTLYKCLKAESGRRSRTTHPRACGRSEQRNYRQERMAEPMARIVDFGVGGIHQLPEQDLLHRKRQESPGRNCEHGNWEKTTVHSHH